MNFLDGLIVWIAKRVLGAVMAIGTALVYLQFIAIVIVLVVLFGTLAVSVFSS